MHCRSQTLKLATSLILVAAYCAGLATPVRAAPQPRPPLVLEPACPLPVASGSQTTPWPFALPLPDYGAPACVAALPEAPTAGDAPGPAAILQIRTALAATAGGGGGTQPGLMSQWWVWALGAAVGGGVVAVLASGGDDAGGETPPLPSPMPFFPDPPTPLPIPPATP